VGPLQLSFSIWFKPLVTSLGLTVWKLLKYTSTIIKNAHKLRKKTFDFHYVAVICTTTGGTEQIRAGVKCYDQSAWIANEVQDQGRIKGRNGGNCRGPPSAARGLPLWNYLFQIKYSLEKFLWFRSDTRIQLCYIPMLR